METASEKDSTAKTDNIMIFANNVWFGCQCVVEYSISWDDDAPIPWRTYSTEGIESETACGIVTNNSWFVWMAVCGWILNHNIVGLTILQQQQKQKNISN